MKLHYIANVWCLRYSTFKYTDKLNILSNEKFFWFKNLWKETKFNNLYLCKWNKILILTTCTSSWLTKPGEVGKIITLFRLVAFPRHLSEIKVTFLFASRSFLTTNLCLMVKLIDKAIVINVKIHRNERERLYSSNKEGLTCCDKRIAANV